MRKIKNIVKLALDVVAFAVCARFLVAAINIETKQGGC